MVASSRLPFGMPSWRTSIRRAAARARSAIDAPGRAVVLDAAEEAALVALVAGDAADLLDLEQDRVGVAVDEDLAHVLQMAGGLALHPELAARRAPVGGAAGLERVPPGLAVHVGDHQDLAGRGVLRDRRQRGRRACRNRAPAWARSYHGPGDKASRDARWTDPERASAKGARMKLAEIARALGCELRGDGDVEIAGVAPIEDAAPGDAHVPRRPPARPHLATTRAVGAILLPPDAPTVPLPSLRARASVPRLRGGASSCFHPAPPRPAPGVHPTRGRRGERAARAGRARSARTSSSASACVIGRDAVLHAHVDHLRRRRASATSSRRTPASSCARARASATACMLHAGAVIGSDGFGYLPLPDGNRKIPQIGTVVLEDDVEIGANATVDRATLGATRDRPRHEDRQPRDDRPRLPDRAHCLLAAQVGLAGSTTRRRARHAWAARSGAAGHLTIGDGAQIGAQARHAPRRPGGRGVLGAIPPMEARLWRRVTMSIAAAPGGVPPSPAARARARARRTTARRTGRRPSVDGPRRGRLRSPGVPRRHEDRHRRHQGVAEGARLHRGGRRR